MSYKKLIAALALSASIFTAHAANEVVIQVGSFRNLKLAEQQVGKAALAGIRTRIVAVRQNNTVYYRVHTEPLTHDKAEAMMKKLNQNQIPAMIINK